ncbi:hypothetical protein ILUMI_23101 [Ignelater luminosus]|uniref:Uncharacterized protein n=1 Tax=Ignelater luminosus TaxID=2038154 RepID=A0A8K0CEI0_IGNLU|nr:hypothetical protein ILUMI_23101 [Ignelater luminosus]
MKVIVAVCLVVAVGVAHGGLLASTLVRTPSLDSAIIKSDRIGGNFAYSTVEGHAYAALAPIVHQSVVAAPFGFAHYPFIHHQSVIAAHPIISHPGIIAQAPIITSPIVAAPAPIAPVAENPSAVAIDEDTVAVESA